MRIVSHEEAEMLILVLHHAISCFSITSFTHVEVLRGAIYEPAVSTPGLTPAAQWWYNSSSTPDASTTGEYKYKVFAELECLTATPYKACSKHSSNCSSRLTNLPKYTPYGCQYVTV